MKKLRFNEIDSTSLGLFIQTSPVYQFPERDMSSVHIPGRNGDLHVDNKCYKNVDRSYNLAKEITYSYPDSNFVANADEVLNWLTSAEGQYVRLEDDYDPGVYRLAMFNQAGSFTNIHDGALAYTVSFNCKPQRFLTSGEEFISGTVGNTSITINNPTKYETTPLIMFGGIEINNATLVMVETKDADGTVISNVSLTGLPNDGTDNVVSIDSETQEIKVYKNWDELINGVSNSEYTSLNGKPFPSLRGSSTAIEIKAYTRDYKIIKKYNDVIDDYLNQNDGNCISLYKPYSVLEADAELKLNVPSYKSIINGKALEHNYESYSKLLDTKAEEYEVIAFDQLLNSGTNVRTFSFSLKNIEKNIPVSDFFSVMIIAQQAVISASKNAFYMIKLDNQTIGKVNGIFYRGAAEELASIILPTEANVTIYMYNAKTITGDIQNGYVVSGTKSLHVLDVAYPNQPQWLVFNDQSVKYNIYETDRDNYYLQPIGVNYKAPVNAKSLIWTENKNPLSIFGQVTSWKIYGSNEIIKEYNWSTATYSFESTDSESLFNVAANLLGLSAGTSAKKYKYGYAISSRGDYTELHYQYDESDDNNVKIVFKNSETDFSKICLRTTKVGYYSFKLSSDKNYSDWVYNASGAILAEDIPITKAFSVRYLDSIPTYNLYNKDKDASMQIYDFPFASISGTPDFSKPSINILNSNTLYIAAKNIGSNKLRYRMDYTKQEYDPELNRNVTKIYQSKWLEFGDKNFIKIQKDTETPEYFTIKADESFVIYSIDTLPTEFENNRSVNGESWYPSSPSLSWLTINYTTEKDPADETKEVTIIEYRTNAIGYYRWNSNPNWVYKDAVGELLFTTAYEADAAIYYFANKPQYDEDDRISFELDYDTTGNPRYVNYKANIPGYYRVNTDPNWVYFEEGQQIYSSVVNTENTVNYLDSSGIDIDDILSGNFKIKVKPRWWKL